MCNLSRQHGRWWTAEDGGSWAVRGGAFTEKITRCKSINRLETASEHSRGVKGWLNDMWWSGELTCLVMWQLPNNFLSHHYCAASNCYVGVIPPFTVTHRWHSIRDRRWVPTFFPAVAGRQAGVHTGILAGLPHTHTLTVGGSLESSINLMPVFLEKLGVEPHRHRENMQMSPRKGLRCN